MTETAAASAEAAAPTAKKRASTRKRTAPESEPVPAETAAENGAETPPKGRTSRSRQPKATETAADEPAPATEPTAEPKTPTRRSARKSADETEAEPKPPTSRSAKRTAKADPAPASPEEGPAAARKTRRKADTQAEQPAPEEIPTPEATDAPNETPRRPRSRRTAKVEPAAEAAESPTETDAETKPRSSRRRPVAESPAEVPDDPDVASVAFRQPEEPAAPPSVPEKRAGRRGRARETKVEVEVEANAEVEPTVPAAEAAVVVEGPTSAADFGLEADDDLFPIITWRTVVPSASKAAQTAPTAEDAEPSGVAPRKSRRRRRRRGSEATAETATVPGEDAWADAPKPEPADHPRRREERATRSEKPEPKTAAAGPRPSPEPEPAYSPPPPRPLIPTPKDAPQVVLRNGVPTLVRDGRVYPPIMFFGSAPDERKAQNVFEQAKFAAEAGIHLHSVLVEFEVDEEAVDASVSLAAYLLDQTLKADPEAQVIFRIVFVAPRGWDRRFPQARYLTETGRLAEPSVCDDEYWGVARECLAKFVRQIRLIPQGRSIAGLHLERGEWFLPADQGYDTSPAATRSFREWARARYSNGLVALRASWFDGQVSFDTLQVPPFAPQREEAGQFMRVSRKERRWVDYHLFLSDATVQRIGDLAYAAKEASEGRFLVGVSYGYTFEWSHPSSGHLSLGKLLRTPEIDFIAGPPSYRTREPGGAAPFPTPIDSFALNGKLFLSEEDYKTPIGDYKEPDDFNPVIKTPQALESVQWRGVGAALAHMSGVCWMDLWGNGWLKSSAIWERGALALDCLTRRMTVPPSEPDVTVFIDERALAYLVDQDSFALLVQNVRESVLRSGLSAGFYLLSDLAHREHFPESKLYIFLNAWDIRPELRAAIKSRLQRDKKVLFWLYSAGIFDSGRESLERAREVTGIALKPQPYHSKTGTTLLNRRHPLCESFPDKGLIGGARLEPTYFAIPEGATVLGEYSQTGLPSFVVRDFTDTRDASLSWRSVFMGEPVVTPGLVRNLGQMAGAHVWNFQNDVTHVRPPFLTVHCTGTGPRTLMLPNNWVAYGLEEGHWRAHETPTIRFNALDGSTHVFLVGIKEELEAIINAPIDELTRIDDLPERAEDTIRYDLMTFDVPIMALDAWIEGGLPEEVSDDWLVPPRLDDLGNDFDTGDAADEPERRVGRRRRRKGRGRSASGDDRGRPEAPVIADADLGLGVQFRKRD